MTAPNYPLDSKNSPYGTATGTGRTGEDQGAPAFSSEPSMDEILSSIRRILNDDDTVTVPADAPAGQTHSDSVMILDAAMMIPEPSTASPTRHADSQGPGQDAIVSAPTLSSATPPGTAATDLPYEPEPAAAPGSPHTSSVEAPRPLLGASAAEAAASHIGALVRTISADRTLAVTRGGTTIEDIVREEIRPMLKSWLDSHLPGLVERVVRAEIERLVGHPDGF
ncbi:MAG: DUF2497 domain-containing protein [Acidiphilium sp.]|nr:DUF2497 domain-containing protein [Acidiphilium sp.]MDD4934702.1 DUF2497 domain-containing protein [Acidiphilium sp.]